MTANNIFVLPDPPTEAELIANGEVDLADDANIYASSADPMAVVRQLIQRLFKRGDHETIRYWRGDFWTYTGTHWEVVEDVLDVKAPIWDELGQAICVTADGEEKPWRPTTARVQNLMEPLAIESRISNSVEPPAKLAATAEPAGNLISTTNGIFDLKSRKLLSHSAAYFTTWSLPFAYDPDATCPTWLKFLDSTYGHDPAGLLALQESFGNCISQETKHHKGLMVIGPPRAGKGLTSGVLQALMGTSNVATTTFHDLGAEFGLTPLIGKPLTVIEDARGDDNRRNNLAVERVLNIVANDPVSINRKNRDYWNGRLNTRLVVFSNEVPRFKDSSGAILNRFVMIRLVRSFNDQEQDKNLAAKLHAELPGIFNWALEGLDRLNANGSFTTPGTDEEVRAVMADMTSPMEMFFDDCNEFQVTNDPSDYAAVKEVHRAYKHWASIAERNTMNQENFAQTVTAAFPGVRMKNTVPVEGVKKNRYFFGVRQVPGTKISH